jgi:hypothetical protein
MRIINKIRCSLAQMIWMDPPDPPLWIKVFICTTGHPMGLAVLNIPDFMLRGISKIDPNTPLLSFCVKPKEEINFQIETGEKGFVVLDNDREKEDWRDE